MPIPAALVPAAIAAGGSIVSTGIGALASHRAARRSRQFSRQQIKEMNEYNHPSQQMQRLKSAGLNPMLMYGQGTVGQQTEVARPQFSEQSGINPTGAISEFYNVQGQEMQHRLLNVNAYLSQARLSNVMSNTHLLELERQLFEATFDDQTGRAAAETAYRAAMAIVERKQAEWAEQGFTRNDSVWLRNFMDALNKLGLGTEFEEEQKQRYNRLKKQYQLD